MCQVRLPSSALAEALMPLFTIHGSRQANGNQVTWTSCNQKEVLKPGATGRVCRLNSSQPAAAKVVFSLSLSLSLSHTHTHTHSTVTVVLLYKAKEVGRNCYHKNPARTHPSHPRLALISQPSREETTQHTRPSCPIIGPAASAAITEHIHTHTHTHTLTQRGDRFCEYLRVPIGQQQGCVT